MRRQLVLHQLWIVAAAAVICFTNLGSTGLWDEDEPLYASCAREMLQRGDWVVPMYNGEMFPDKPPLMFWTMIGGFKLFGVNEFGARFWSAVLGIGTALATYHLGRRLFCAEVGFWAGLIVASSLIFTVSARAATVDSALLLVTTLAILCFVVGKMGSKEETGDSASDTPEADSSTAAFLPDSWIIFTLVWTCLGVAVLAKGPIGLLLPAASIGLFLMIMNHRARPEEPGQATSRGRWKARLTGLFKLVGPGNFLRSLWQMRPVTGILVVAAIALPWFILVGMRTGGEWPAQFFAKFNWRPFTQPIQGHSGPIWYHVASILIGFFPWSVFMAPTLIHAFRRTKSHHRRQPAYILLACWVGVFFVFWSICSTKLPHYVLPAYPALALLTACFLHAWIADPEHVSRWWLRAALAITVLVGVGFTVVFPVVASIYVPGEEMLGCVGLILVVGGGACLYYLDRGRQRHVVALFAGMCVVLITAIFGFVALRVDRYQNAKPLIASIRQTGPEPAQFAGFNFIQESVVFYAAAPVRYCEDPHELRAFLDESKHPFIFTTDEQEAEIERHFPGELSVLTRRPRFLHSGEIVVLARRADPNVARTADRTTGSGRW